MKRSFAEVNLHQLATNFRKIRGLVSPHTKIMGVVKADAYGHGAVEVSELLVSQGVDYLGVAWEAEAAQLRLANIKTPILVLSEPVRFFIEDIVSLDVSQTVYTLDFARTLSAAAQKANKKVKVHLKVDTGMGRIGVQPVDAVQLLASIQQLKAIEIEGIFTHFACADDQSNDFTLKQLKIFNQVLDDIKKEGLSVPPLVHTANSEAIKNFPDAHLNMVRAGIMLYDNVMTFKSNVTYLKKVKAGTPLSYGSTFVTEKESIIATISAGYADGYSRLLSNKGVVLINGKRYPVVGRICMDMFLVDVTNSAVSTGDEVVLIGKQGSDEITMTEISSLTDTISYEVMCGIGKRVPRIYL